MNVQNKKKKGVRRRRRRGGGGGREICNICIYRDLKGNIRENHVHGRDEIEE
jgi:hypothetical protein